MKLTTDGSTTRKGFEARFRSNGPCGSVLTGESGEFKSPHFPWNYPDNAKCLWMIIVPEGKKVHLEFQSFNVSVLVNIYVHNKATEFKANFHFSLNLILNKIVIIINLMIRLRFMMLLMANLGKLDHFVVLTALLISSHQATHCMSG